MAESRATLITGGAGYIGSHAVLAFRDAGLPVVVLDDLSTGRRDRVPGDVPLVEGDAGDAGLVGEVIRSRGIATVVHFAGSIVVPESVPSSNGWMVTNQRCASPAFKTGSMSTSSLNQSRNARISAFRCLAAGAT